MLHRLLVLIQCPEYQHLAFTFKLNFIMFYIFRLNPFSMEVSAVNSQHLKILKVKSSEHILDFRGKVVLYEHYSQNKDRLLKKTSDQLSSYGTQGNEDFPDMKLKRDNPSVHSPFVSSGSRGF
jgi:hypothetical protein